MLALMVSRILNVDCCGRKKGKKGHTRTQAATQEKGCTSPNNGISRYATDTDLPKNAMAFRRSTLLYHFSSERNT